MGKLHLNTFKIAKGLTFMTIRHERHLEQPLRVSVLPRRGGCELYPRVILPLQLLLMRDEKPEVTDVIQDHGVMHAPPELAHLIWEKLVVPNLELQRVLEERLCPLCFAGVRSPQNYLGAG